MHLFLACLLMHFFRLLKRRLNVSDTRIFKTVLWILRWDGKSLRHRLGMYYRFFLDCNVLIHTLTVLAAKMKVEAAVEVAVSEDAAVAEGEVVVALAVVLMTVILTGMNPDDSTTIMEAVVDADADVEEADIVDAMMMETVDHPLRSITDHLTQDTAAVRRQCQITTLLHPPRSVLHLVFSTM
jgi:hypothetical protein